MNGVADHSTPEAVQTPVPEPRRNRPRLVKALALRVALSIALVVFLLVSYHLGWIAPSGLR